MENEARNEIDEMLSDYDEQVEAEQVEQESEEAQSAEVDQDQETEPEPASEPAESSDPRDLDEQPVDEQPVVAEPAVEVESDDLALLREQNEMLVRRVEELSAKVVSSSMIPPQMGAQAVEQAAAVQPKQVQTAARNFLGDLTIDDLLESPESFNNLLNQVAMAAREQAVAEASERVMRAVPELVVGYTTRHTAMNKMVDEFYQENPDLSGVKQTVAAVANDLHSKHPDKGVDEIFKMTAEETRKFLGLKKAAMTPKPVAAKRPAFAKQKTARREEPQVNGLQKEINDLLSDMI